eukprot:g5875.t1
MVKKLQIGQEEDRKRQEEDRKRQDELKRLLQEQQTMLLLVAQSAMDQPMGQNIHPPNRIRVQNCTEFGDQVL